MDKSVILFKGDFYVLDKCMDAIYNGLDQLYEQNQLDHTLNIYVPGYLILILRKLQEARHLVEDRDKLVLFGHSVIENYDNKIVIANTGLAFYPDKMLKVELDIDEILRE